MAKTLWLRVLESPNLAHADALHFTSVLEHTDAQRLGVPMRRAAVIANGVELADLPQADVAAEPYVLHLGRVSWKKGLDQLVRALSHAPDVRALIAGNDEEGCRASLERLARECGVAERVRFAGPVYGEGKWRLLRGAHALVLPSHSENFGNAVLEAMAVARPVIVSPAVGLAQAVRASGCGMVVEAEPRALGNALQQVWRDEALRRSMGARGRELAEREYSWPRIAGQMVALYQSIVRR